MVSWLLLWGNPDHTVPNTQQSYLQENLFPRHDIYEFHALLHPLRCGLMGRSPTARTCWPTEGAWPCWWWVSSSSPHCWSWPWLRTAAWLATFSWACASSPTAALCTRTCQPLGIAAWAPAAAAAEMELMATGRGRFGCEMEFGGQRARKHWFRMKGIEKKYKRRGKGLYNHDKYMDSHQSALNNLTEL